MIHHKDQIQQAVLRRLNPKLIHFKYVPLYGKKLQSHLACCHGPMNIYFKSGQKSQTRTDLSILKGKKSLLTSFYLMIISSFFLKEHNIHLTKCIQGITRTFTNPLIPNKTNLQRVARVDIIRMDLSPDQGESTESSPSLARQSIKNWISVFQWGLTWFTRFRLCKHLKASGYWAILTYLYNYHSVRYPGPATLWKWRSQIRKEQQVSSTKINLWFYNLSSLMASDELWNLEA